MKSYISIEIIDKFKLMTKSNIKMLSLKTTLDMIEMSSKVFFPLDN